MKIYIAISSRGRIKAVTTDLKKAQTAADRAERNAYMTGDHEFFWVEEHEVEE